MITWGNCGSASFARPIRAWATRRLTCPPPSRADKLESLTGLWGDGDESRPFMLYSEDETIRHGETVEAFSKVMHIVQLV